MIDNNDDLQRAAQLERQGDEASILGQPAAESYRESQRLLLPAGMVWTNREAYAIRIAAFDRIQQKIYELDGAGRTRTPVPPSPDPSNVEPSIPSGPLSELDDPLRSVEPNLSVWQFYPGLEVRVVQDFRDYDGQELRAGEVLRFLEGSYFFYDGGHTLVFAGKTIRLADVVVEHQAIIANIGNAWFQPLGRRPQ